MPLLLSDTTHTAMMADATRKYINGFSSPPNPELSWGEEYAFFNSAFKVLEPLFSAIKHDLNLCEKRVREHCYVRVVSSFPKTRDELTACRCNYVFLKTKKEQKLYYFRPKIRNGVAICDKEEVLISDKSRLDKGLQKIIREDRVSCGESATFEEYFEGKKRDVIYLTAEQVQDLIVSNGGHQQEKIHPLSTADQASLKLAECELQTIRGLCLTMLGYTSSIISDDKIAVEDHENKTKIHEAFNLLLRCSTFSEIICCSERIEYAIQQGKVFTTGKELLSEVHSLQQQQLKAWENIFISVSATAALIGTGMILTPVMLPTLIGILGEVAAVGALGAISGAAGGAAGSAAHSWRTGDSLEEGMEKAHRAAMKGAIYGAVGGVAAGALHKCIGPSLTSKVGKPAADALIGGASGGASGAARGAIVAKGEGQSLREGVKISAKHATIGLGVGVVGGAVIGHYAPDAVDHSAGAKDLVAPAATTAVLATMMRTQKTQDEESSSGWCCSRRRKR